MSNTISFPANHQYTAGTPDPSHPFIATAPAPANHSYQTTPSQVDRPNTESQARVETPGRREELDSENERDEYDGDDDVDDEMAELSGEFSRFPFVPSSFLIAGLSRIRPSVRHAVGRQANDHADSYSSVRTSSRPVTPSHPAQPSATIHLAASPKVMGRGHSTSKSMSVSHVSPEYKVSSTDNNNIHGRGEEVFSLAHKAERILGLTPGTLAHARACLENARDEVRRTGAADSSSSTPEPVDLAASGNEKGMKGRMQTRARKAMSVAGFPTTSATGANSKIGMPGVVLGAGGKDEEERREKRRRAADGVLYWQREVARLGSESEAQARTVRRR